MIGAPMPLEEPVDGTVRAARRSSKPVDRQLARPLRRVVTVGDVMAAHPDAADAVVARSLAHRPGARRRARGRPGPRRRGAGSAYRRTGGPGPAPTGSSRCSRRRACGIATTSAARARGRGPRPRPPVGPAAEVVEQHDALGQRHGTGRPGDDGQLRRAGPPRTASGSAATCRRARRRSARTADPRRAPRPPRRGGAGSARSLRRRAGPELAVELVDRRRGTTGRRPADRGPRRRRRRGDVVADGSALHGVDAVESALEAHRVDAGQLVDRRRVAREPPRRTAASRSSTSRQPAEEAQVAAPAVHDCVELGVVGLAVLPAGGDRRDRALGATARTTVPRW